MALFFKREPGRSPSPVPCHRYAGLEYHACIRPRGHQGKCHMVTIGEPPRVSRPDPAVLIKRKLLVWAIADRLHQEAIAKTAWGDIGLQARLDLASKILELVRRNQALDGGLQSGTVIP